MRNPAWIRDEIILAMDLYFRAGRKQLPASHADVIRLSQLLNALPIHAQSHRDENFRNPTGIEMILGNFLGIDPTHAQSGLGRNNHLQQKVWDDFVTRVPALRQTAEAIERCIGHDLNMPNADGLQSEEDSFPEGALLARLHRTRERSRAIVEKKKSQVLAKHGRLACEACGFDFYEVYGELGLGFAECHHTLPLAEAVSVRATRLSDLAIVCANCHRMLHRACTPMTVEVLQELLSKKHTVSDISADTSYATANLS